MPDLSASELILNKDGSIYHLNLLPQDIAQTIITVGDPDRVEQITRHFDKVYVSKQKREFKTQTGCYKGKDISVIATGIGTDNIDIVLNELDALVNIDFKTRRVKENLQRLKIIRLGTSGAVQPDIPIDSLIVSELAIGFDNLIHYYASEKILNRSIVKAFIEQTAWAPEKGIPYVVNASNLLLKHFESASFKPGFTATNTGFYAPQGRMLRALVREKNLKERINNFNYNNLRITNLEMETSAIYGLSQVLGHDALSLNAILANRSLGTFSPNPEKTIDNLIEIALDRIKEL